MGSVSSNTSPVDQAVKAIAVHQHLCLIYESRQEQFAVIAPFIKIGLERNEQCLYIAAENSVPEVLVALAEAGIMVEAALEAGALVVTTQQETYLKQSTFNPDCMLHFLAEAVELARASGFSALRVTGEMTWVLDSESGLNQLLAYETKLNHLIPDRDIVAICQYNRRRFPPELLLEVMCTHPHIIFNGLVCENSSYIPPEQLSEPNQAELKIERLLSNIVARQQTETVLRESEAQYRSLVELSPDAILVVSEGRYVYANPAATGLLGASEPEDIISRPVLETIHPESQAIITERLGRIAHRQSNPPLEIKFQGLNGQVRQTESRSMPFSFQGRPAALVIGRDLSHRQYIERREELAYELVRRLTALLDPKALLAETVNHLAQTFGYYHSHIYLLEAASTPVSTASDQAGRLVVKAATGEAGADMIRNRHTISLAAKRSLVAHAARTLEPVVANEVREHPYHLPNLLLPETQSEAAIPLFTGNDLIGVLDVQHTDANHFDLNEVRTLQLVASQLAVALTNARLFAENGRRLAIIENSSDLIALAEPDNFRVIYINPAGTRLLGCGSPAEVVGRTLAGFYRPEQLKIFIHEALPVAFERGLWRGETYLRRADDRLTPIEQMLLLIRDERGQPQTLATIITDITERKGAEQILRQRNRALGLLNRAGRVFISTLDLDQVLAVILEEVRHGLDVIAASAWLIDPTTGELVCRQVTDPQSIVVRGWRLKPGQGLAGWAAKYGESLIVGDIQTDDRHFKGVDELTGLALRSILTVPLRARQKVIGVLQIVDVVVDRFTLADLALLESLAATAAVAIENARLYEQARQDAETKSTLLDEVNHRVKNNLATIVGLLYAEQRHAGIENQPAYQAILHDLINRVQGLATVHSMLSASEWKPLSLAELARQVVHSSLQALPRDQQVIVSVSPSSIQVSPEQAHHLALVINELTTNTIQHGLTSRPVAHIIINLSLKDNLIRCEFRDDGPGYPQELLQPDRAGCSLGFELIQNVVHKNLRGKVFFDNDGGAVTIIQFEARS